MGFDLEEIKAKINTFITKNKALDGLLTQAAEKVPVDKEYILVGAVALVSLITFLILGQDFIVDLVGVVYPMYASLKAIDSSAAEDDKQWLTYWIVYTVFKVVEGVADIVISSIPFYFIIKLAFLVWCYHPATMGATAVYDNLIAVHLNPHLGIGGAFVPPSVAAKSEAQKASYPRLIVVVEKLTLAGAEKVNAFVEVMAQASAGRAAGGIEGTVFKTPSAEGREIAFQHSIVLAPLPQADGQLRVQVKSRETFGEDEVLGEKLLPITELAKEKGSLELTLSEGVDLKMSVEYQTEN